MIDFEKKISIGYCTDESYDSYINFFDQYSKYIGNLYFSMPLGDRFHARSKICRGLRKKEDIELFWNIIKIAKDKYNIKLEVVFNTPQLLESDFFLAARELKNRNIRVDLIGIVDMYYSFAEKYFPNVKFVHSFNNFYNNLEDYKNNNLKYHQYVIGRQNIRNIELFKYLSKEKKSEVVLLLNNGCSHICGGCKSDPTNCHNSYFSLLRKYTPEKLYSLYSIMPFEIHDKLLDVSNVSMFKISTRNADLEYASKCIDSYVFAKEESYIKDDLYNFELWGRQTWHQEYYSSFKLNNIIEIKRTIYDNKKISKERTIFNKLYIQLENDNSIRIFKNNYEKLYDFLKHNYFYLGFEKFDGVITDFKYKEVIFKELKSLNNDEEIKIYLIKNEKLIFVNYNSNLKEYSEEISGNYIRNLININNLNDYSIPNTFSDRFNVINDDFLSFDLNKSYITDFPLSGILLPFNTKIKIKLVLDLIYQNGKFDYRKNLAILKTISEGRVDIIFRI